MMNAPRKRLDFTNIEVVPFTIKMPGQWKVVPLKLIGNLKIDVGGVKKMMTFIVIDLLLVDSDCKKMLGKTKLKQFSISMQCPFTTPLPCQREHGCGGQLNTYYRMWTMSQC